MRKFMKNKGFTLIELVIVMTLVGILVAIALPQFKQLAPTARTNVKAATAGAVKSALSLYMATSANNAGPTVTQLAAEMSPAGVAAATGVQFDDDQTPAVTFIVLTFTDATCSTPTTAVGDTVLCVSGTT